MKEKKILSKAKSIKNISLSLIIGLALAAGLTFAWNAVWHGTDWIKSGEIIESKKMGENFEFLNREVGLLKSKSSQLENKLSALENKLSSLSFITQVKQIKGSGGGKDYGGVYRYTPPCDHGYTLISCAGGGFDAARSGDGTKVFPHGNRCGIELGDNSVNWAVYAICAKIR